MRLLPSSVVKSQGGAASFAPTVGLNSPPGESFRFLRAISGVWDRIWFSFTTEVTKGTLCYLLLPWGDPFVLRSRLLLKAALSKKPNFAWVNQFRQHWWAENSLFWYLSVLNFPKGQRVRWKDRLDRLFCRRKSNFRPLFRYSFSGSSCYLQPVYS